MISPDRNPPPDTAIELKRSHPKTGATPIVPEFAAFVPKPTADGSFTFYSPTFGEQFHSRQGARQEAALKFVEPTQLREKAETRSRLCLLDICYGLGYNSAVAVETIWAANPTCHIELIALELDAAVPLAALEIWQQAPHSSANESAPHAPWPKPVLHVLAGLATNQTYQTQQIQAQLLLGDARQQLQVVARSGFQADAIFLDPFSPPHCPQLWTVEFLTLVARCLGADGRLATYSCAAAVRHALMAAGLHISATPPVGRKSPGTVASWTAAESPTLSQQEQEHLQTRAAIPYRDRTLYASAAEILQRRDVEQQASSLEPTSRWKKRWSTPTSKANSNPSKSMQGQSA